MRHHLPVRRVRHAHQAEDGRAAGVHQRRAVLDNQSSTALTMRPDRWPLGLLGQSTNIKKKSYRSMRKRFMVLIELFRKIMRDLIDASVCSASSVLFSIY